MRNQDLTELELERTVNNSYDPVWYGRTQPYNLSQLDLRQLTQLVPFLLKKDYKNWLIVVLLKRHELMEEIIYRVG